MRIQGWLVVCCFLAMSAAAAGIDTALPGEMNVPGLAGDTLRLPARVAATNPPVAMRDSSGAYSIDLMVVFTPRFSDRYGGVHGARAEVDRLIGGANRDFEVTGMPIRYRLAAAELYTGISETIPFYATLDLLAGDKAIVEYRNLVGADLVILLRTNELGNNLCGLSTPFNGGTQSELPDNVDADRDAYMVAGVGPSAEGVRCGDYIFAHELGHGLAGGHEFGTYWRPYSHGWSCGGPNRQVDVMADATDTPRGDFFSSPLVSRESVPCGTATYSDNARAMLEAAPYVAAYRP